MPLILEEYSLVHLIFEQGEHTSSIQSRAGFHIFFLSVSLCCFDEPVKLFPFGFVKMVFIHFKFCLMPALTIFAGIAINLPINVWCSYCYQAKLKMKIISELHFNL
jgi:hypothetical protein